MGTGGPSGKSSWNGYSSQILKAVCQPGKRSLVGGLARQREYVWGRQWVE